MPPVAALLLCSVFVVFLLRAQRRSSRHVSPVVWIPTFWLMVMASRPLRIWFGTGQNLAGGNESGSSLDSGVLTALTLVAVLVLVRRRFDWWGSFRRHKWLIVLLGYMFLSTLWSDITLIALRRSVREAIVVVMAFLLMSETNPRQALAAVLRRSAYILIPFSLVLIKYYPSLGRAYGRWSGVEMWTGVTGQKNELGRLCMIGLFFLLWSLYVHRRELRSAYGARYQRWADISVIFIGSYLLIGSHSSTSLATFAFGVVTFVGLRLIRKIMIPQTAMLMFVILLMAFGLATPFVGGATVARFTGTLGRDDTLTGRTDIWADVLPAWEKRPVLGYGLGSFWTDARRELYKIPTSHNGYLDILLDLGEVGLTLYTIWLLSCTRQLHRALALDYEWASLAICLLIMGLVYNISESALNTFTEEMTAVMAMVSLAAPYKLTRSSRIGKSRTAYSDGMALESAEAFSSLEREHFAALPGTTLRT